MTGPADATVTSVILLDPGNFTPYYVDGLCRGLADLGVRPLVLTSPPSFEAVEDDGRRDVAPVFFPWLHGRVRDWLRRRHRTRRLLKAITYPAGVWRTWRLLRVRPPGILHVQWALVPPIDALVMRMVRRRGWRVVYTVHDLPPGAERGRSSWWHTRLLLAADAVVLHTDALAASIARAYPMVAARTRVVRHGTSAAPAPGAEDRAAARAWLGIADAQHVLLWFGMIRAEKGLEHLIDALPEVLRALPGLRVVIAGEPLMPLRPIERRIGRLGMGEAILWRPGFVPAHEVSRYFAAADLVVSTHVGRVGVSGVVVMAQSAGLPVIATSVGGLPELVEPSACGWIVAPRSASALTRAILDAFEQPGRLAEMGRRARERVTRGTDWREVAVQTIGVYSGLARQGSSAWPSRSIRL